MVKIAEIGCVEARFPQHICDTLRMTRLAHIPGQRRGHTLYTRMDNEGLHSRKCRVSSRCLYKITTDGFSDSGIEGNRTYRQSRKRDCIAYTGRAADSTCLADDASNVIYHRIN